jgi:hypothetical protein
MLNLIQNLFNKTNIDPEKEQFKSIETNNNEAPSLIYLPFLVTLNVYDIVNTCKPLILFLTKIS